MSYPNGLNSKRPDDINLVTHLINKALREQPTGSITLTATEARTLMRSISNSHRRLCDD